MKLWLPKVQEKLIKAANREEDAYPQLKSQSNLQPSGVFKRVMLLEGWLVVHDNVKESGECQFTWQQ